MHAPRREQGTPLADAEAARFLAGLTQIARARTPQAVSRSLDAVLAVLDYQQCMVALAPGAPSPDATAAQAFCATPLSPQANNALAQALMRLVSDAEPPEGAIALVGRKGDGPDADAGSLDIVAAHWGTPLVCALCATRRGACAVWVFLGGRVDDDADAFAAHARRMKTPLRLLATALAGPLLKVVERRIATALPGTERDVLGKLAQGMRPVAIAAARGAAETTVRNQIARGRRRIGAASDAHAVAIGLRRGLI